MAKKLNSNEIAELRILIKRFEKLESEQSAIIHKMKKTLGQGLTDDLTHLADNWRGIRREQFSIVVQKYLDELAEKEEQYDYKKLNLRPQYLSYMIGLGYTEEEVVNTYNETTEENEELTDDPTTLEVITRDKLEKEKHGSPK